jgi:parallel beta-helix repeat protein
VIEDNQAFENGNHGFIISRGCNNMVFRRNNSYNNQYTISAEDRKAHGFMLDPGSPNSQFPQVPSHDNLYENNQAWGNDGYGLRVVGSNTNKITSNNFAGNVQGITLEQGSTGNVLQDNTILGSGIYGIYLFGGADGNTITGNTISGSGKHGIYFKTGKNIISGNIVSNNGTLVNGVPAGSGIASLRETDIAAAIADLQLPGTSLSIASADPELLSSPQQATEVAGNLITKNTVTNNVDEGIELKGATGTKVDVNNVTGNGSNGIYLASGASNNMVTLNTISGNRGHGIRANGLDTVANQWTKNLVYNNGGGGIVTMSGANNGVPVPQIVQKGKTVTITTMPGAVVEIYSDSGGQGRYFESRMTATTGTLTLTRSWKGSMVNATATDSAGNTSGFARDIGSFRMYMPLARIKR